MGGEERGVEVKVAVDDEERGWQIPCGSGKAPRFATGGERDFGAKHSLRLACESRSFHDRCPADIDMAWHGMAWQSLEHMFPTEQEKHTSLGQNKRPDWPGWLVLRCQAADKIPDVAKRLT